MKRNIITIDENKCNGCGLCINACHEGALQLVNGVAKLVSDSYCDGLGNCLPACPKDAIKIVEREADPFDEEAVMARMKKIEEEAKPKVEAKPHFGGCPGSRARAISRTPAAVQQTSVANESQLRQWPCQIKLVPVNAPYLQNAHLLIAADCVAYAYADMHNRFMKNKITLIGCPKLDEGDYSEKLSAILANNDIKSVTVVRMEVPCCGGIEYAVKNALLSSGKMVPWQVVVVSTNGEILEDV